MAGQIAPGFEAVHRRFARIIGRGGGGGALAVELRGERVVDLWAGVADAHGRPWTPDTPAIGFSTGKGVASTIIHRLADRGTLDYDESVASYWPEFGVGGKDRVTVRDVLTHRAGLHSVRAIAERAEDLLDHLAMEERLAGRAVRAPTSRSAYHAFTYGWLLAGIARRATSLSLPELARREIVEPLGLEGLYFGVPDDARELVAEPVGAGLRQLGSTAGVMAPLWTRTRHGRAAMEAMYVPGFHRLFEGAEPPVLRTEMPAVNGMVSARALAGMYAPLANRGRVGRRRFLAPETVDALRRVEVRSADAVLGVRMSWRLGFHHAFGAGRSRPAFGHYGFGGSGGWADPVSGLSVGFVTNRIASLTTPLGDLNLFRLNRVVRECLRESGRWASPDAGPGVWSRSPSR